MIEAVYNIGVRLQLRHQRLLNATAEGTSAVNFELIIWLFCSLQLP